MKLLSFREALKKTKAQIDELLIPVRVKQSKLAGETELARIEEKLLNCEVEMQELCVLSPIDYTNIIAKLDEIALLERQQQQLQKVMTELFDENF